MWLISYCSYSLSLSLEMPIPSLPIEIVSEIVSYLRTSLAKDAREAIKAGQSISLVCRSWYTIGQALCWRTLTLEATAFPSLVNHFTLHPHLALLVRGLRQTPPDPIKEERGHPSIDAGFRSLAASLALTVGIRKLVVDRVPARTLQEVLRAACSLSNLQTFRIAARRVAWTSEFSSILGRGSPSITTLRLIAARLYALAPIHSSHQATLPVVNLSLGWISDPDETPLILKDLLPSLSSISLRTCTLSVSAADEAAYMWLSSCPGLQNLVVIAGNFDVSRTFTRLINHLPRMLSLKKLQLELKSQEYAVSFPIALDEFLRALPPNLGKIKARDFIFEDYLSISQCEKPSSPTRYRRIETSVLLDDTEDEDSEEEDYTEQQFALILWAEQGDNTCWYRRPLSYLTWEEKAERSVSSSFPLLHPLLMHRLFSLSQKESETIIASSITFPTSIARLHTSLIPQYPFTSLPVLFVLSPLVFRLTSISASPFPRSPQKLSAVLYLRLLFLLSLSFASLSPSTKTSSSSVKKHSRMNKSKSRMKLFA